MHLFSAGGNICPWLKGQPEGLDITEISFKAWRYDSNKTWMLVGNKWQHHQEVSSSFRLQVLYLKLSVYFRKHHIHKKNTALCAMFDYVQLWDTNLLLNALEKQNWTKANKKTEHWISTVVPLKQQDILHSPPSTTGVAYLRDLAAARKLTSLQTRKVTWHWVSFTQHISTFHPAADLLMRSILQNTNGFPDT